jgi:hypothetical protein
LRKEGNMLGLPINNNQAKSLPLQREIWRVALPWVRSIQRYQNYCLDDNIQIYSYGLLYMYVNTSWACTLFRNNKQHVVPGQKRNCQRVEESGLWRIQRERWIEVNLPNGTNAGYM